MACSVGTPSTTRVSISALALVLLAEHTSIAAGPAVCLQSPLVLEQEGADREFAVQEWEDASCDEGVLIQLGNPGWNFQKAGESVVQLARTPIPHWRPWIDQIGDGVNNDTAAKVVGVQLNGSGDLEALMSNLLVNTMITLGCLVAFPFLRRIFPLVYKSKALSGVAPPADDSLLGWLSDVWQLSEAEIQKASGLDGLMFVKFCELCMKILLMVGLPIAVFLLPVHASLGGLKIDRLSRLGLHVVSDTKSNPSLVLWIHATVTWILVVAVQHFILQAQKEFLRLRFEWLEQMPLPRRTTVLVEGIPEAYRSDAKLRGFFESEPIFGEGSVREATVVKYTQRLLALRSKQDAARQRLKELTFQWEKAGTTEDQRPYFHHLNGERVDTIDFYTEEIQRLEKKVSEERNRILDRDKAEQVDLSVNCSSGFVTFVRRDTQEQALKEMITEDSDEFVISLPPDPGDVIYADLEEDPRAAMGEELLGMACLAGIYIGFLPIVVGISSLTQLDDLEQHFPFIKAALAKVPTLEPFLDSMLAVVALKIFMSFLPTLIMVIARRFFRNRAEAWAQHRLQLWYFGFLIIFELFATAIGSSLVAAISRVIQKPALFFTVLGNTLPTCSHFYLNYMLVSCGTQATMLTRYVNLAKFLTFRAVVYEETAHKQSEPEDQDYYGMGARTARLTEAMVIVLVFSTISPLISFLGLLHFALCWLVYRYLLIFAETKKADFGGRFWVTQLGQLQLGVGVHVITLTGILSQRADDLAPAVVAGSSLIYLASSYRRFNSLRWEKLPRCRSGRQQSYEGGQAPACGGSYVQPELLPR